MNRIVTVGFLIAAALLLFSECAIMANAGIKGSQSGTSAKALMTRLGAMNRNADFARSHLGVDFVDQQSGEVRRLRDIVGDFRKVFNQGMDVGQAADFFEKLSGEKVHADTRRKLESFLKNVQEHGGKMTGADKLKMASMLSGQEAMSGWLATFLASEDDWNKIANAIDNCDGAAEKMAKIQLDNLAGDITLLGSAWDAFQRNLVKGGASESLRGLVQTLTEVITKANELFSDGIQIGDFGAMIADVVTRLKNKFLEFDGIGSILAGGALMAGLLKITKTATNLYRKMTALKTLNIGAGIVPPTPTPTPTGIGGIGASQQVTSMVVHANSVVVNGRTGNFGGKVGNQAYVDNYYKRRGEILAGQTSSGRSTSPTGLGGIARNGLRVAGGASILAGIFGAMDIFSARNHSKETLAEADATVAYHKQELARLKSMDDVSQDQLKVQIDEVKAAEDFRQRTLKMNNQVERQAEYGAFGAVAGTALGAALGSAVPVIGTAIGGIIGGILGDFLGTKAAELVNNSENNAQQNKGSRVNIFREGSEGLEQRGREMKESEEALRNYGANIARRNALDKQERQRNQHYAEENKRFARSELGDMALAKAHNDLISKSGGYEEQNAAAEKRHQELIQKGAEVAKIRDEVNANYRKNMGWNSLYGNERFLGSSDEERKALAAYEEDRKNKILKNAQERRASEQVTQEAQVADFLNQKGKSYNQMMTNAPERKGEEEHRVIDTNPFEVAKKNLDEQATASHKQIDAQNELTQKIRDLNKQAQQAGENKDFFKDFSIGDFLDNLIFNKAAAQKLHDEEGTGGVETSEVSSPNYPQYEKPDLKEKSFNISDMLPDFSLSEWLSEKTADIDLTSILPDFSSIGETIGEQLNIIPEKVSELTTSIGEGFSQIPTAASEAFNTISTAANEGLTTIQTTWNELPSFFGSLFDGLGGVATSAGAAIADGLNSAIGTIQSAWEGLSSWLSAKISSLSSMASNAISSITSFGGGGSVSPKAEGGFITSPQHILAGEAGTEVIIPLATSRRTRAMDLLRKAAAIVGGDSVNVTGDKFKDTENISTPQFDKLGNLKGYGGLKDNLITADDDLFVKHSKQEQQLKEFGANNSELGEGLSIDEGAVTSGGGNVDNSISGIELGGINASFDIGSTENPQEVMQTIRENLGDLADQISGKIAEKISEIRMNMPLMA